MVDIKSPDFVAVAKGNYLEAARVENRENLEAGIQKMLDAKGPYILEIKVEKEENVFPMVPSGASVEDVRLE